ncbi:hypothetical protein D046_2607B, partial [Vibrio parahaemolyticus V-223/04]
EEAKECENTVLRLVVVAG